jgi:hypothetical protein
VLQEINREGMALEAKDPPSAGQRMRMRLGVFFYAEPVAPAAEPARERTEARPPRKQGTRR